MLATNDTGGPWTAALVGERLIAAFRLLPSHPVYCVGGRARVIQIDEAADPLAELGRAGVVLGWAARFVLLIAGERPDARLCVLTWARARTADGYSVAEFCREFCIWRSTFDGRRDRALREIAAALNALTGTP